MDSNITTAWIISGGSVFLAITALVLSHRGFAALEVRFISMEDRFAPVDARFASIEKCLDMLQNDIKDLSRRMKALGTDLKLIRGKLGWRAD